MLLHRFVSGAVGIPLVLLLLLIPGGLPYALGVALVGMIGAHEFYRAVRRAGISPSEGLGLAGVALFLFATWGTQGERLQTVLPAVITALILVTLTVELFKKHPAPIRNFGATLLGAAYSGWLLSYLILLRFLTLRLELPQITLPFLRFEEGAALVLLVLLTNWACDTSAFLVGRKIGRTPLAPNLSPNKSREGAVAGLLGSLLVGTAFGSWLGIPLWASMTFGALVGVLAQVGDMAESAMKRELGIKDFGGLLPGHGGVLDRVDSLLFTAPAAYYFLQWVLR